MKSRKALGFTIIKKAPVPGKGSLLYPISGCTPTCSSAYGTGSLDMISSKILAGTLCSAKKCRILLLTKHLAMVFVDLSDPCGLQISFVCTDVVDAPAEDWSTVGLAKKRQRILSGAHSPLASSPRSVQSQAREYSVSFGICRAAD